MLFFHKFENKVFSNYIGLDIDNTKNMTIKEQNEHNSVFEVFTNNDHEHIHVR